jgi:hypothetical protein
MKLAEHVRIFAQAMPFSIIGSTEDIQPPDKVLSEHLAELIDTRHVLRETTVRSNQPAKFAHLSTTARFLYSSMTIVKTSIQVCQMSNLTSSLSPVWLIVLACLPLSAASGVSFAVTFT